MVSAVVIIYGESVNHPKFSWTEERGIQHTILFMWAVGRGRRLLWGVVAYIILPWFWQSDFQETSWCVRINRA